MNEGFTTVIETLEAAENEMSELHNLMERLESIDEASWHETQTIADYRKRLSGMGQVVRSMFAKRENAMLEKVRAEHSLHTDKWESPDPTGIILPLSWDTSQSESTPPTCG